jgi:hypothetical protein
MSCGHAVDPALQSVCRAAAGGGKAIADIRPIGDSALSRPEAAEAINRL